MSVYIKQNDASGNNADLFVAGRSVLSKDAINDLVDQKLFTTAKDIDGDKTTRNIALSRGIPKYKGSVPDSAFLSNGYSISQGESESSGVYFDGDAIKFWCPFDTASDETADSIKSKSSVIFYDEDDGRKMFKITTAGKAWSAAKTSRSDEEYILPTKSYVDKVAVPNTSGMYSQSWSSGSTYTAPDDGWVYLYRSGAMSGGANSYTYFYVKVTSGSYSRYQFATGSSQVTNASIMCPVAKGDSLYFYFSNSSYAPGTKYFVPNKAAGE